MQKKYSAQEIRTSAREAIDKLENGDEDEFLKITENLLLSKQPFRLYYIYGEEIGKRGLEKPDIYLEIMDKLFRKSVKFGYDPNSFKSSSSTRWTWTEDNIKAMILGARMAIISVVLGIIGERYPMKVVPRVKESLIYGDGWYICDGVSIAMGMILKAHFDQILPILIDWAKSDNRWLRRAAVVSNRELFKQPGSRIKESLIIFDLLMKDDNKDVKRGVSWMLREMTKNYKDEMLGFIRKWIGDENKHTKWIIKHGIIKLLEGEREQILIKLN